MELKKKYEIKRELACLHAALCGVMQRATGRTTRLVDNYIQALFCKPDDWLTVSDHYNSRQAHKMLVDIIKGRLYNEHHLEIEYRPTEYGYKIRLKNYKPYDLTKDIAEIEDKIKELRSMEVDLM